MTDDPFYADYDRYKGWSDTPAPVAPGTFENIVAIAGKQGRLRILELGFGDGAFLDWARAAGHAVIGSEIRPEAIAAAAKRGHEVYSSRPEIEPVDLVVALDVFEHLTTAQLLDMLEYADRHLREDGVVVARFPNGASPMFGFYQFSDMTHVAPRTALAIKQIALLRGFEVVRAVNPRPRPPGLARAIKRRLAYWVRDLAEIVLGLLYYGYRVPLDPNIVVVMARAPTPRGSPPAC